MRGERQGAVPDLGGVRALRFRQPAFRPVTDSAEPGPRRLSSTDVRFSFIVTPDLIRGPAGYRNQSKPRKRGIPDQVRDDEREEPPLPTSKPPTGLDRKSTRLTSSH